MTGTERGRRADRERSSLEKNDNTNAVKQGREVIENEWGRVR